MKSDDCKRLQTNYDQLRKACWRLLGAPHLGNLDKLSKLLRNLEKSEAKFLPTPPNKRMKK